MPTMITMLCQKKDYGMNMNKILNTRISLKVSTQAEWNEETALTQQNKTNANYVLHRGEIGIVEIPDNTGGVPNYVFKVGDGVTPFKSLNCVYANAKDVPDWAKQSETSLLNWLANYFMVNNIDNCAFTAEYKEKVDNSVRTVSAAKDCGLKADRSGDGVTIDIDDSMTFIFNCGNADIGAVNTVVLEDNGSGQTAYV